MATSHAISREDANKEIRRFLAIREEINQTGLPKELSDGARNYLASTTLSFVFHKNQVDNLFKAGDANAYRIYFAAKENGNPTLVIFPCTITEDEKSATNKMSFNGDGDGDQYGFPFSTSYDKSNFDAGKE
jgi:hypothetical protein